MTPLFSSFLHEFDLASKTESRNCSNIIESANLMNVHGQSLSFIYHQGYLNKLINKLRMKKKFNRILKTE